MTAWKNLGDIDPKSGTFLIRNPSIKDRDFTAEVVVVLPESNVGGSDRVFDIGQGTLFLDRDAWNSALRTIGNRLEGDTIVQPDHHGGETRLTPDDPQYLIELAHAAQAYSGPEYDISMLVGIGIPTIYDGTSKFPGEAVLYPSGTSFWSIVKNVCDGFSEVDGVDEIIDAEPLDLWDGPYAGTPRDIRSMADLGKIRGFAACGLDDAGHPKVWRHEFVIPDDNDDPEIVLSAHEFETYSFEGELLYPSNTTWVGPKEQDLVDAWESLYDDSREPAASPDEALEF